MKLDAIPFNKPFIAGKELDYISQTVVNGHLSGDGPFTKRCHAFFRERFGFQNPFLTTSCTDALEMAALLLDVNKGDEIICPSFTFVSTANAFALRGAKMVFIDSCPDQPNLDPRQIESVITGRTKAIVVVHYGGVACDMDEILRIAARHHLHVVEDAAHAIDAYHNGMPLGTFGTFGAFSFHETKNIISGEGGMLVVNNPEFCKRAEIIREKGTNRSSFFRGEVDRYNWVDIGSSFLPSDVTAAFLFAQLESLDRIQQQRKHVWRSYYDGLKDLAEKQEVLIPCLPANASSNGHLFYLVCRSLQERTALIKFLGEKFIHAVFHYQSLHRSPFHEAQHDGRILSHADRFSDCLVRLPLYYEISDNQITRVVESVRAFYRL